MNLTIGILTYNSGKYIQRCLESILQQEELGVLGTDWQVVVRDNASTDRVFLHRIEKQFSQVRLIRGEENLGFAAGHNAIMRDYPATYHAVLNDDLLLEPRFIQTLLEVLEHNKSYGSAVGKLLHWDVHADEERTCVIDSAGLTVTDGHAMRDMGQGLLDTGQYDETMDVFGGSGAAVLYRRNALEDVAYDQSEFFDETFFMYKEDVDLAYRLLVANYRCRYTPDARGWHARSASSVTQRSQRRAQERIFSASNHSAIIRKHWHWLPWQSKVRTYLRECVRWLYLLCFEYSICRAACARCKQLPIRVTHHTTSFQNIRELFA